MHGTLVRPHIVWFGETQQDMDGDLSPAETRHGASGGGYIYVGPEPPFNSEAFDELIEGAATEVLPGLLAR